MSLVHLKGSEFLLRQIVHSRTRGFTTKLERIAGVRVRLGVVPRVQKCDVRVDVDLKRIRWLARSLENGIFHTFSHYKLDAEEDEVVWHHRAL
jgi:hypothetical protein